MSFLLLNGWRLPVRLASATEIHDTHGELGARFTNRPSRSRVALPRSWRGVVYPFEAPYASTLVPLLEGRGHHVTLERNLWSQSGLGPEASADLAVDVFGATAAPPGYSGSMQVTNGKGIVWDADLCMDRWTVLYWESTDGTTWSHVAFRSDLARWVDGVRNDGAPSTRVLVEDGAVVLFDDTTSPYFAGLVILPYNACDAFIEDAYLWLTAHEMAAHWRLDGDFADDVGGNDGTGFGVFIEDFSAERRNPVSVVVLDGGPSTDRIEVGTDTSLSAFGNADGFTVEGWIRPTGIGVGTSGVGYVYQRSDGATVGIEFGLTGAFTSSPNKLFGRVHNSVTNAEARSSLSVVTGVVWQHVAMTFHRTGALAGQVRIYLNGERLTLLDINTVGSGALGDDTAETSMLGGDSVAGSGFAGALEAWSFRSLPLGDEAIADVYECGRAKLYSPLPRKFSALPALELHGDIVGCRSVEVLGRSSGDTYTQGGSKLGNGFRSNTREQGFELDERLQRRPSLPVRATLAYQIDKFQTRPAFSTTTRYPLIGEQGGAAVSSAGVQSFVDFPFAPIKVRVLSANTQYEQLGAPVTRALVGGWGVSVLLLARRDAVGVTHTPIMIEQGINEARLFMQVTAANQLRFGGRSIVGDGLSDAVSAWSDANTGTWQLYGGFMDLRGGGAAAGRVGVMQVRDDPTGRKGDEVVDYSISTGKTFTAPSERFSDEPDDDARIGVDVASANGFVGAISHVYLFVNHIITRSEALQFWRAWRAGGFK